MVLTYKLIIKLKFYFSFHIYYLNTWIRKVIVIVVVFIIITNNNPDIY